MMMSHEPQQIIHQYTEIYHQLYQRMPSGLKQVDQDWVIVNGAQIHLSQLQILTQQLHEEHQRKLSEKRSLIGRLVKWFTG